MPKHEKHLTAHDSQGNAGIASIDRPTNGRDHDISFDDQIRLRAYELYLERGGRPDDDLGDWLQAEQELRGRRAADAAHS